MFKFDNATYIHIPLYLLTFLNGQPIKKKECQFSYLCINKNNYKL